MNVAPSPYLSFFAGAGGLDIGTRLAFPEARCVGYVENEITAAETVAANIAGGALEDAPIWSDVRTFPSRFYRGRVAGIVAGFPCPDYSVAGKRAGIIGKHGQLWDHLAAAIRDVGPDWVCLENVSGILIPHGAADSEWTLPAGLWFVLGDLAALRFDAEWCCLRASDVGASHQRMRWFCMAYARGAGRSEDARSAPRDEAKNGRARRNAFEPDGDHQPERVYAGVAITSRGGLRELRQPSGRDGLIGGGGANLAHAKRNGRPQHERRAGESLLEENERELENPARNERNGLHGEGRSRRGIREAGNELEHSTCAQRPSNTGSGIDGTGGASPGPMPGSNGLHPKLQLGGGNANG